MLMIDRYLETQGGYGDQPEDSPMKQKKTLHVCRGVFSWSKRCGEAAISCMCMNRVQL
jgi:hypothetical protein